MTTIRAVRLDVDGTLANLQLPIGYPAQIDALHDAIGDWTETCHYARPDGSRRLAVVVNANGIALGLPPNLYATSLVNFIRQCQLPYELFGPVVLVGAVDGAGALTDIPEVLAGALPQIMAALKDRYAHTS